MKNKIYIGKAKITTIVILSFVVLGLTLTLLSLTFSKIKEDYQECMTNKGVFVLPNGCKISQEQTQIDELIERIEALEKKVFADD